MIYSNIQLNYLYRDGGNYKKYNSITFANPTNNSIEEISSLINSKLLDQTWFYASEWQLPDLRLSNFNLETDPTWHEFESVTYTDEPADTALSLAEFINLLS